MSRKYLGIEIQQDAVNAVMILSGVKSRSMEAFARIALDPLKPLSDTLKAALDHLQEEMDIKGCTSVLSFPMDKAIYRNLRIPFSDIKKIRQVLPGELEPMLPFPIESLVIDFQKIQMRNGEENIFAVAAKPSELAPYLETLREKADPESLLPGAYAAGAQLAGLPDMPEDWLLLDVHSHRCDLLMIHHRKICLIRTFPIDLSTTEAVSLLGRQLQQTIFGIDAILESDFIPSAIWVTGSGADDEGLIIPLGEFLKVPVHLLDLFDKFGISKKEMAYPDLLPHQMNTALACAVSASEGSRGGLNLRQGALAAKSRFIEYKQAIIRSGIFLALTVILAFANLLTDIWILQKKSNRISQEIVGLFKAVLPDTRTVVQPVHQLQAEVDALKKKAFSGADSQNYLPAIDILHYLSRDIPEAIDVRFSKLVVGDQSILISGSTDSFNSVNEMKSGLERNKLFKVVRINSADMEQTDKRVKFKIQIQL